MLPAHCAVEYTGYAETRRGGGSPLLWPARGHSQEELAALPQDAGAASGVVNVAHQLGGSLCLAVLVVYAAAGSGASDARGLLAHRIAASLTAGTAMLACTLAIVVVPIVLPSHPSQVGPRETA